MLYLSAPGNCHIPFCMYRKIFCCLICFFAMLLYAGLVYADDVLKITSDDPEDMWHLAADKLTSLNGNTIVEAEGKVILTRGNDILEADFARYYVDTDWVYLKGKVFIRMGRDDLHADSAEFDLHSRTGWLTDGNVFMDGPHIYFKGSKIIKHDGDRYTFSHAKLTTCDGDTPVWSMNADQAFVEIDGYAQLYKSSFDVKDTGIFYTPFLVLPAKTTRQSGLLVPDYGLSNKRGLFYTQPLYWAIDKSRDMTLYAGWMEKIGPLAGFEYRAHEFSDQKTWLSFTTIQDKHRVTDPWSSSVYSGSELVRTNHNRFWLRGMADGFLGTTKWRYHSNLDIVSDQEYLREFRQGPMGFSRSRSELSDNFGRDLAEEDQNRINGIRIDRDWNRFGLVASLRYEQDASLGHGNRGLKNDELVQELPRLDAFFYKGRIMQELPLEFEAQFSNAWMYRAAGTTGLRAEFYPKISLPLDLRFLSLISSVGLRQTWYNTHRFDHTSPLALYNRNPVNPKQSGEKRFIPDLDLQAYTETNRIWQLGDGTVEEFSEDAAGNTTWTALRHEIQPRLRYKNTPSVDQDDNPFYIKDDRILPTNEISWSLTNILTRKGSVVNMIKNKDRTSYERSTRYEDMLRWRLESGYDFREEQRHNYIDHFERRPFMDILSDLELYPASWFSWNSKTWLSPYDGSLTRADETFNISCAPWAAWGVGISYRDKYYDYRHKFQYDDWNDVRLTPSLRLLHNTLSLNINPEWSIRIDDYRNMREGGKTGKAYDQTFELAYKAQCYQIIGRYSYDGYDKSWYIMVKLPGIFD